MKKKRKNKNKKIKKIKKTYQKESIQNSSVSMMTIFYIGQRRAQRWRRFDGLFMNTQKD